MLFKSKLHGGTVHPCWTTRRLAHELLPRGVLYQPPGFQSSIDFCESNATEQAPKAHLRLLVSPGMCQRRISTALSLARLSHGSAAVPQSPRSISCSTNARHAAAPADYARGPMRGGFGAAVDDLAKPLSPERPWDHGPPASCTASSLAGLQGQQRSKSKANPWTSS